MSIPIVERLRSYRTHDRWTQTKGPDVCTEAADLIEALVGALERTMPLARLATIRQALNAGDEAIDAAGLNPWCVNEGRATGDECALSSWRAEEMQAILVRARGEA